jgi:hypothetical protein
VFDSRAAYQVLDGALVLAVPHRELVYIGRFKSSRTHLDREYHVFEATMSYRKKEQRGLVGIDALITSRGPLEGPIWVQNHETRWLVTVGVGDVCVMSRPGG